MRNKIRTYLLMTAVSGITGVLLYLSALGQGGLLSAGDSVKFYLKQPVTVAEALAAAEQNQQIKEEVQQGKAEQGQPLDFCIWGRQEDVPVANENLSRQAKADVVFLCGNPELLFADSRIPAQEDTEGCLIDEKTAWELFGSTQVAGKEVTCQKKSYTIRKVIAGEEPFIAVQVSSQSGAGQKKAAQEAEMDVPAAPAGSSGEQENRMNRMEVRLPEDTSVEDLQLVCMSRYGFSPEVLDMELLAGMGGACLLLAPVTFCIFFGGYLYRLCRNQESVPGKAGAAGACLGLAVLLLAFLKHQVHIPDAYIPTRWSEFSFWSNLWKDKTEGIRLLMQIPKSGLDSRWMKGFAQAAACGLLAEGLVAACGIFFGRKHISRADTQKYFPIEKQKYEHSHQ